MPAMSDHSHDHNHEHGHAHGQDNLRVAFFLNLGFALLEIFGGIWTNSLAILSDAVHDLGDSLSLGLSWYLERYSKKSEDRRYSYGYRRFSLLAALLNTVILLSGSLIIMTRAIPRLMNPEQTNAPGMALMAILGIAMNGIAVLRMRSEKSENARIVAWHLLEDVLGWVAVLVVSIVLLFADLPILDPLLSILIAIYILVNVVRNLRRTLGLFLQEVPSGIDLDQIEAGIQALQSVESTHHMHAWSLEGESHVLTLHVVVEESASQQEVIALRKQIRSVLSQHDFAHMTIEIEYGPNDCMMAA